MRVVVLQDYLRGGGTERQTILTVGGLKEWGEDVTLITFRPGGLLWEEIETRKIAHVALQKKDRRIDWYAPGLFRTLRKLTPDIVLCMGRVANCYGFLIKNKCPDIKLIATVRTGKNLSFLYRRTLGVADCILVNCQWWKKRLVAGGLADEKIRVIYNPLKMKPSNSDHSALRKAVREELKVDKDTHVFINVAEFRAGKHQDDLLRIFKRLEQKTGLNIALWLLGSGRELERCRRLTERLGLGDRVQFLGYQTDVFRYYAGADVAVSTSHEDSLPNFLIEAQSFGLPVIARDYAGVGECFAPGESGYLLGIDDKDGFCEKMVELAENLEIRKKMSEKAEAYANEQFDREQQLMKTWEVLRDLIRK